MECWFGIKLVRSAEQLTSDLRTIHLVTTTSAGRKVMLLAMMEKWLSVALLFSGFFVLSVVTQFVEENTVDYEYDDHTSGFETVSETNETASAGSSELLESIPLEGTKLKNSTDLLRNDHDPRNTTDLRNGTDLTNSADLRNGTDLRNSTDVRNGADLRNSTDLNNLTKPESAELPTSEQRKPSRPIHYVPPGLVIPNLPFESDEFRHQVFEFVQNDTKGKNFTADCATRSDPRFFQKPGYLVGIWDDKDNFANIEKIKCLRGGDEEDDDEPDDNHEEPVDDVSVEEDKNEPDDESDEDDDDVFFELDPEQRKDINLNRTSPTHRPSCPIGYLLTGLTKVLSDYDTAPVVTGHCLKLIRGAVDYDVCEQKPTASKSGGPSEHSANWGVECQFGHSAVGVALDGKRVKHLRCCKLNGLKLEKKPTAAAETPDLRAPSFS